MAESSRTRPFTKGLALPPFPARAPKVGFPNQSTGSWVTSPPEEIVDDLNDTLSYRRYPIPSPTVLFIKPGNLETLVSQIHKEASRSILYSLAMRHKKAGIAEGFVSKESLWDRLVFDGARANVIGEGAGTLRCVIVSGGK